MGYGTLFALGYRSFIEHCRVALGLNGGIDILQGIFGQLKTGLFYGLGSGGVIGLLGGATLFICYFLGMQGYFLGNGGPFRICGLFINLAIRSILTLITIFGTFRCMIMDGVVFRGVLRVRVYSRVFAGVDR